MGCAGSRLSLRHFTGRNTARAALANEGKTAAAEDAQQQQQQDHKLVYCKVLSEEREWDASQCLLSQQETFKLWTSWNFVHDRVCNAGVHMFLLLFKQHPLLLAIFKKFSANLESPDGLDGLLTRDNPDLKRHSATVMGLLDEAIVNVDKRDLMQQRLRATGRRHRHFTGFRGEFFLLMRDPFLGSVQETLADKCTPAMLCIYEKTIDWVLGELQKGFDLDDVDNEDRDTAGVAPMGAKAIEKNEDC